MSDVLSQGGELNESRRSEADAEQPRQQVRRIFSAGYFLLVFCDGARQCLTYTTTVLSGLHQVGWLRQDVIPVGRFSH